jgi:hypothetical protein
MVRRDWTGLLAAAEQERRQQKRHETAPIVGRLYTEAGQEVCLVKNISGGGLMARVYSTLKAGTRVWVELGNPQPVEGRIAWSRDSLVGIELVSADAYELATRCTSETEKVTRAPRLEVSCAGRLQIGLRGYAVRLCDISEGGAKIQMRTPLKKLSAATLTLPDLPPARGYVRWVEDLRLGIGFDELLPFELLARWVNARKTTDGDHVHHASSGSFAPAA